MSKMSELALQVDTMWEEGFSVEEIASSLGITIKMVRDYINEK